TPVLRLPERAHPHYHATTMSTDKPLLHPESLAAQGMGRVSLPYRDVVPPIYVSTPYERGADGSFPGGRVYSRADNPGYDQAEALIAALEGASGALLFASGQAAAAALFQAFPPGACALVPRNMYWAFRKWLLEVAAPWGLAIEFYENASIDDLAAKTRGTRPRLIWIETPANPTWDITDIAAASAIAREVGAIVAVDSTAATPMLTRPLELGANLVMHSATKYLNGHADVIAGALATARDDEMWQRIRYLRSGGGAVLGARGAWGGLASAARNANASFARSHGLRSCARDRPTLLRPSEALARPVSGFAIASRSCGCRKTDARSLRRHDVAAIEGRRGRREVLHG